jgi:uncharacterized iron-regulated protein
MNHKTVAILVTASFLVSACNDSDNDSGDSLSFDAGNVLDRAANDVITQSYAELDTEAETLVTKVEALSESGATETEVTEARDQWKATREKWEATEAYLFGPVDAGGHDPAMDSWPLDKGNITYSDNTDFDSKEDNLKGFHAVEYLLWNGLVTNGEETAAEARDRLNGSSDQVTYLVNAAKDIESHTTDLHTAWDTGFADTLRTAGESGNSTYGSQSAGVQQLIEGVEIIANEVASGKIGGPFGTKTVEEVESRFSGNSINDFTNNMRGIRNVWLGTLDGSENANGLKAFVQTHDADLTTQVEDAIDEAIDAVKAIGDPNGDGTQEVTFAEAVTNQSDSHDGETNEARIQAAVDAIQALDSLMKDEVSALLDDTDFAQ